MYNKKLLERFIETYTHARKLMESDIRELIKQEDFFMIEYRAKEWKRYNIMECELKRISKDLEQNESLSQMLYVYNEHDKIYREDILCVLNAIKE